MTPRVGSAVHRFAEHGLYDGLFLMMDLETGTFWDHMTGRAVYGPLAGEQLEVTAGLQHTTAGQALLSHPDALITLSDEAIRTDDEMKVGGLLAGIRGRLNGIFESTVDRHDERRPPMDLGLGIWSDENARYYPMDVVRGEGRFVFDTFAGRSVIVLIDPENFVLSAFHVQATTGDWDGKILRLADGSYVESGVLHDAAGAVVEGARPLQVFTRWYGFSLTFPHTGIHGER